MQTTLGVEKLALLRLTIHLGVPQDVLFPPKILSVWEKKRWGLAFYLSTLAACLEPAVPLGLRPHSDKREGTIRFLSFPPPSSPLNKTWVSIFFTFWEFCIKQCDPAKLWLNILFLWCPHLKEPPQGARKSKERAQPVWFDAKPKKVKQKPVAELLPLPPSLL